MKDDNTTGRIKAESKKVEKIFAYFCFYQKKSFSFWNSQLTNQPVLFIGTQGSIFKSRTVCNVQIIDNWTWCLEQKQNN
jgi:hypothetical protein